MNTGATTTVKSIVAAFELARERREMERRRQRVDELFSTTSVGSATTAPAPFASLSSSASSTTPSAPTPTAPTSIDNTSLTSTNTTIEPLQAPPERCSTPSRSHDERALAPVTAVLTPSSTSPLKASALVAAPAVAAAEEEVFTTTPAKCSTLCLSRDSKLRYFTICTPMIEVTVPCLASKVCDAQKVFERPIDQYLVMLWPTFNGCLDVVLSRQPWPPPIQLEFLGSICWVDCSTTGCVFDRGKLEEKAKSITLQVRGVYGKSLITASTQLSHTNMGYGPVSKSRVVVLLVNYVEDTQLFWCCQRSTQFKPPWVSCCSVYGVLWHISIRFQQQQAVSAMESLHGYLIYAGYGQLIIQGNPSAIQCWKHGFTLLDNVVQICELSKKPTVEVLQSYHAAIEFIALNRIVENMKNSVARITTLPYLINARRTILLMVSWHGSMIISLRQICSLVPQVEEIVVLPVKSAQVLFQCYPCGVQALQWSDFEHEIAFIYMHVVGIRIFLSDNGILYFISSDDHKYWPWRCSKLSWVSRTCIFELHPWFSIQCCSSCILDRNLLLDGQSVCYFKHRDPICGCCHWEMYLLSCIAQNGQLSTKQLIPTISILTISGNGTTQLKSHSSTGGGGGVLISLVLGVEQNTHITVCLPFLHARYSIVVIQISIQVTILILRQNGWGCSPNGRASLAEFFTCQWEPATATDQMCGNDIVLDRHTSRDIVLLLYLSQHLTFDKRDQWLQGSVVEYKMAFTCVLMASIENLPDCLSLHLVPPTIISAQEYWLESLRYLYRWLWTVSMIRQKCKFIFSYHCSVIANIQWPRLLSAIGQKNYGVPSVEMAAETLASSIIQQHIIILSSTASLYKHEYELSANQNSGQGNELHKWQNLLHIQESSGYGFLAGINYYQMMLPWDPGKDKHPPGGHKYPGCLMRMTLGHVTLHFIKNCVTPIVWDAGQAQLKHGELLGIHLCGNFNMAAATVQTYVHWDVISTALTMVRWMGIYLPSLAHISSGCTSTSHWYGKIEHYSTIQHAMMLLLFTWPILTVGRVLDKEDFCEQATLVYLLSSQGCKAMMCGGNAVQKHQLASGFHPFALAPGLQLQHLFLRELQQHQALRRTGASPFTEPHNQTPHGYQQFKLQFYSLVIEDP